MTRQVEQLFANGNPAIAGRLFDPTAPVHGGELGEAAISPPKAPECDGQLSTASDDDDGQDDR